MIFLDSLIIFQEDLLTFPPEREMEFTIELVPRIALSSKASYCIALLELKELKVKLQVDKGFIRSSISLWRALMLFVK